MTAPSGQTVLHRPQRMHSAPDIRAFPSSADKVTASIGHTFRQVMQPVQRSLSSRT